ncbi:colicin immunity domain-containing protein [Pseudomonas viridiflava]|uniref:colicin immunity domain-containing protein n=1 Tax=Pseudomonas viridiflava TaxID=33069 RepID=UPI001F086FDC|nr:colicin immunity domain-containing protein [Pseudomonas viridiflava]
MVGRITAKIFSEAYIELWKIERDKNILLLDEPSLSECLSSVYCVADMYEPDEPRESYELNVEMLRSEVATLILSLVAD